MVQSRGHRSAAAAVVVLQLRYFFLQSKHQQDLTVFPDVAVQASTVDAPSADSSGNTSTIPYESDHAGGVEVDFATYPPSWQTFITHSTSAGRCSLGHGFAADDFDYMAHAAADAYQVLLASESPSDALPWQKSDCHLVSSAT